MVVVGCVCVVLFVCVAFGVVVVFHCAVVLLIMVVSFGLVLLGLL